MTLDLDVITDNFYLNSLNCMSVISLFVCYISNRTNISIIFILYLMRHFNKRIRMADSTALCKLRCLVALLSQNVDSLTLVLYVP